MSKMNPIKIISATSEIGWAFCPSCSHFYRGKEKTSTSPIGKYDWGECENCKKIKETIEKEYDIRESKLTDSQKLHIWQQFEVGKTPLDIIEDGYHASAVKYQRKLYNSWLQAGRKGQSPFGEIEPGEKTERVIQETEAEKKSPLTLEDYRMIERLEKEIKSLTKKMATLEKDNVELLESNAELKDAIYKRDEEIFKLQHELAKKSESWPSGEDILNILDEKSREYESKLNTLYRAKEILVNR